MGKSKEMPIFLLKNIDFVLFTSIKVLSLIRNKTTIKNTYYNDNNLPNH